MNYFVLFSVLVIAACVVILLVPLSNAEEGFATHEMQMHRKNHPMSVDPSAAGQRNASSHAGSADGSSDHDHLLDTLLLKHDKLAEAFENRNKTTTSVSSTTTQKKGIASSSASAATIPAAGCDKDKCVKIDPTKKETESDGQTNFIAFRGNCVNPKYSNSDYVNYRIKYCPAFKPADDTIDDQECETCGYYTYHGNCIKKDSNKDVDPTDPNWAPTPKNPSNCDYRDYDFIRYSSGPMPGTTGDDGGDQGQGQGSSPSGPSCSTCKLKTIQIGNNKCVIPGCYSADDGNQPFPDDDIYNFAEGCFDYNPKNKTLRGLENSPAGYYCPPITKGQPYVDGVTNIDPCYITDINKKKTKPPKYIIDYSKFVKMDTLCSNDKQKSEQLFVPGKDAPIDGTTTQSHSHNHKHAGAVNVYHHHMYSSGSGKNGNKGNNGNNDNNGNNGNNDKNGNNANKNRGYMEPEAGAGVLGFL